MTAKLRSAVAPLYLFLCLLFGGSPQGMWGNAILQLLAVAIIAWALMEPRDRGLGRAVSQLLVLLLLAILLALVQLAPLPPGLWATLPGRDFVVQGFELLGLPLPAMPISLTPYDGIGALLAILPPVAMLAAILILRAYSALWLVAALIAGTMCGVLLGILQVASPLPEQSPWYIYKVSTFGVATGFFANSNHMANLLLTAIPFIAAVGATLRGKAKDVRARSAGLALAAGGLVLVVLGLILNQSLAGYGLGVPVVLASLLILFGLPARWTGGALLGILLAGAAAVGLLWTSPISTQLDGLGASTSVTSRRHIAATSLSLAKEFAPTGAGLGSFPKLYQLKEDPAKVDRWYVNHAHNDYLELAVETGVAGILLMLAFLCWWGAAVWRMLRSPASDQYALAGAVASAAVLMHSMVDYPLRTAAIGAVFAMSLSLLLQSRRTAHSDRDLRPVRHLVVG